MNFLACLVLAFWGGVFGNDAFASLPPIGSLPRLRIGDTIRKLPSIARERDRLKGKGRATRFLVYFFDPKLPRQCMNLECGTFARGILAQGAFLIGGADSGYLRELGAKASSSVLLVTDSTDQVRAIYRDVPRADIRDIVSGLNTR